MPTLLCKSKQKTFSELLIPIENILISQRDRKVVVKGSLTSEQRFTSENIHVENSQNLPRVEGNPPFLWNRKMQRIVGYLSLSSWAIS